MSRVRATAGRYQFASDGGATTVGPLAVVGICRSAMVETVRAAPRPRAA
jgi:hypothetical protein